MARSLVLFSSADRYLRGGEIDAKLPRDVDIPIEALRISDDMRPLSTLNSKAKIIVFESARAHSFAKSGQPIAGGLALVEAAPRTLVAFNAGRLAGAKTNPKPTSESEHLIGQAMGLGRFAWLE